MKINILHKECLRHVLSWSRWSGIAKRSSHLSVTQVLRVQCSGATLVTEHVQGAALWATMGKFPKFSMYIEHETKMIINTWTTTVISVYKGFSSHHQLHSMTSGLNPNKLWCEEMCALILYGDGGRDFICERGKNLYVCLCAKQRMKSK